MDFGIGKITKRLLFFRHGFEGSQLNRYETFTLGDWTVDPAINVLRNETQRVSLQPQTMNLLVYLAAHHRKVVSADELLENLWEGKVVTTASVYSCLKLLREALGDDAHSPNYIETIPRRGYRLIAKLDYADTSQQDSTAKSGHIKTTQSLKTKSRWRNVTLLMAVLAVGISLVRVIWIEDPVKIPESVGLAPNRSVAVLPFIDLTPGETHRWYSDGLAEEVLNRLAQLSDLKVTGRMSSFTFRQPETDLISIGDTLGVNHLVKGSVVRDGARVLVMAQLVRVADGLRIWSQEYDSELADAINIQKDIFSQVANALGVQGSSEKTSKINLMQPAAPPGYAAYELYLQSLELTNQNTKSSLMAALTRLEKALEIEPEYAEAHVAMARTYLKLVEFTGYYQEDWFEESRSMAQPHVERALAINPNLPDAYAVMGDLTTEYDQSIDAYEKALALNPNLYQVHLELGVSMLDRLRPWNDIVVHLDRAVEIEPLSVEAATMLVLFLQWMPHRWEEAQGIIANLSEQYPESNEVKRAQAEWFLFVQGSPSQAIPLLKKAIVLEPDDYWARMWLKRAWYMIGETERAMESQRVSPHWRYVLAPDRDKSLRQMQENPEWAKEWSKDLDHYRRLVSAYTYVMLRDWQSAIDLLASDALDLDELSKSMYVQNLAQNDSPAMSLATAYKNLGDKENFEKYAAFERKAVNIRTENGKLHNHQYSRAMARLDAMEGRPHEAMLELEYLITRGSMDPRELLHPAFDDIRDDPEFTRIADIHRQRVNAERTKLGLEPLNTNP